MPHRPVGRRERCGGTGPRPPPGRSMPAADDTPAAAIRGRQHRPRPLTRPRPASPQNWRCSGVTAGRAAEDFAAASVGATAQMANHATQVALDCEHIPAAWMAAQNWLKVAPQDPQAALVYATVALKLYRVPEARAAITTALAADAKATDADLVGSMQVLVPAVRRQRGIRGPGCPRRYPAALGRRCSRRWATWRWKPTTSSAPSIWSRRPCSAIRNPPMPCG